MKQISLIAPFYNEGHESVNRFYREIKDKFIDNIQYDYEIICIDDGSTDDTLISLQKLQSIDPNIIILEFSRNFGKESALSAGLENCSGDAAIPIDADLQDPPELCLKMIEKWELGADIVAAKRTRRDYDSFIKKSTANSFYYLHNKLSDIHIEPNVGDFRLLDRCVIDTINKLPETQRFMKGLFTWVGFNVEIIEYERPKRINGKTKFSNWKLWNFALEGFTSFSTVPLRLWTYIGIIGSILSIIFAFKIIFDVIVTGVEVPGYASIVVSIIFFGSLQLLSIGIIGEYLGRIYMESKKRPLYIIKNKHFNSNHKK